MRTSTTVFVATSLILYAGFAQAQSQQQTDQQQNQASPSSQQQSPQSYPAPSPSQDSSGQSGGSMSQGTSQSGAQQNDSSQPQSQSTAQSTPSSQPQNDMAQTGVQPQTENGITYMCGGVGEEQASYMKQSKGDYDLMLTFATRSGEYLADVDVAIKDAKGKPVFETTCGGPILLVNLPRSGVYRVQAQAEDYSLRKTVKVKAKSSAPHSVVMTWPRDPAESVASVGSSQEAGSSGGGEGRSKSGSGSSKKHRKSVQPRQ